MSGSETKHHILRLLADGRFLSGTAIAEQLGITRSGVNLQIQELQRLGVDIFSVRGKGYRLAQPLDWFESYASDPLVNQFTMLDSTNQWMLQNATALRSGEVCVAEYQTAGRGRRGRQWVSPLSGNIYMSMFWQLEHIGLATGVSLMAGIEVCQLLRDLGLEDISIKWPNDIYFKGRKCGGILVELAGQSGGTCQVVTGLGLNMNIPKSHGDQISQAFNSLGSALAEQQISRPELFEQLKQGWRRAFSTYEQHGFAPWFQRWNSFDSWLGKQVTVHESKSLTTGVHLGINEAGCLLLETELGIRQFYGGEVSLRRDAC